jgi:hypothetical protein
MSEENTQKRLDEVDKLQLKIAWAELTNVQLQIRILRSDLLQAERLLKEKAEEMQRVRDSIAAKYGVDLSTTTVDDNGNFVPVSPDMRAAVAANTPLRFG